MIKKVKKTLAILLALSMVMSIVTVTSLATEEEKGRYCVGCTKYQVYWVEQVDPTCEQEGVIAHYSCKHCGRNYYESSLGTLIWDNDKVERIPALGHEYSIDATCQKAPTCERCGAEDPDGQKAPNNHTNVVTDPAVEPTCTETGLTAGSRCADCKVVIVAQSGVPSKGHKVVDVEAVPATCEHSGTTAGTKCSTCGVILSGVAVDPQKEHQFIYGEWSEWTDCDDTDEGHAGQQKRTQSGECQFCGRPDTKTEYQGIQSKPDVTQFQLTVKCINEERGHRTFVDTASGETIEAVESLSYSLRAEDCTLTENQDGTYTLTVNVEWYLGQFNGRATYMHRSPVETVSATLTKGDGAWIMDSTLEVGVICIPVTDTHNPDTRLGVLVRCVEEENHSLLWQEVERSAYTLTNPSIGINEGTATYPAERYPFCATYAMTVEGQTDFVNRYYNGLLSIPAWEDRIGHEHKLVDESAEKSVTYYWDMEENVWVRDGESYLTIEVCDSRISYLVTFSTAGGSEVESQTVKEGDKATRPTDPTRSGYTFNGWTLDGAAYDFTTPVTGDITLVAQWTENYVPPVTTYYTLTINYVDAEGNTVADPYTRDLREGRSYSVTSPEVEGYTTEQTVVAGTLTGDLTVTVVYTADENVEDPDTPLVETPDVTETPEPSDSEEPDEDLGDEETPLAETPDAEPDETEELGDNDTPLAEVPQTGDSLWLWLTLAVLSAAGLAWIGLNEKKAGKRIV